MSGLGESGVHVTLIVRAAAGLVKYGVANEGVLANIAAPGASGGQHAEREGEIENGRVNNAL